jgi:hypothetical protein
MKARRTHWSNDAWTEANDRLEVRKRVNITPEEWPILAAEAVIDGKTDAAKVIIHIASLYGVKVDLLGETHAKDT